MPAPRATFPALALLALQAVGLGYATVAWHTNGPDEPRWSLLTGGARQLASAESAAAKRAAALLEGVLRAAADSVGREDIRRTARPIRSIRLEERRAGRDVLHRTVGYEVRKAELVVWAKFAEDLPSAVSWFLEREAGARWFTPGADGSEVDAARLGRIALGAAQTEPGFPSRAFSMGRSAGDNWTMLNRLQAVFDHGHTAASLITLADLEKHPEMAPTINGTKVRYATAGIGQPDLNSPVTVEHVSARLAADLRAHPGRAATVFGQNDSWRWDQSPETLAAVAPARHFRDYPNYSNALFGFLNQVAARLAPEFPDRLISTYAYQWTEDTPSFPVAQNILPFLTADRSQWFDPEYRAQDEALIKRWLAVGPRVVGLYDYYYGAPFLVPRPTLYAVRESIPFAHRAGVRAFYAETYPNWGLDGPKLWLAAQLLWNPAQNSAALLDEYYARYWREAAAPIRRFFELCDQQYLAQPKPAYWLKYYKDDHQRLLFPADVRRELTACLEQAGQLARTAKTKRRLQLLREAFAVTDLFCRQDEQREVLAHLTHAATPNLEALRRAMSDFTATQDALIAAHLRVRRDYPWAFDGELLGDYLRNDPRPKALRLLAAADQPVAMGATLVSRVYAGRIPAPASWLAPGFEILRDGALATVEKKAVHPFVAVDWNAPGSPWFGTGEPFRTRTIELLTSADGARVLRYAGANQEGFAQHLAATPQGLYRATVQVRGQVSPGNMTFLLVVFLDPAGRFIGAGHIDRLPLGRWEKWTSLELTVRAPAAAARMMFSLRTLYQVGDDFAEFRQPSLRVIPEAAAPAGR